MHNLFGDATLVVELHELLLLSAQFAEAAFVALGLAARNLGVGLDVFAQGFADRVLLAFGQQQRFVFGLDRSLDLMQRGVGSITPPGLGNPAEAGVILVVVAGAAAMAPEAESLAAGAAVQRAGQVVSVPVGAVTTGAVRVQYPLNLLESLLIDDRLVAPVSLNALARDDAEVVVVSEHPVDHAPRQRFARPLGRSAGAQASLGEHFGDRRDCVGAGSCQLEAQPHVARAVGIDRDRGNLTSTVDRFSHVEIADASRTVAAAVGVLAFKAELDLDGVLPGAKGVDTCHERKYQKPLRAVVDWLARGDE